MVHVQNDPTLMPHVLTGSIRSIDVTFVLVTYLYCQPVLLYGLVIYLSAGILQIPYLFICK